jgi:hypothetical protein
MVGIVTRRTTEHLRIAVHTARAGSPARYAVRAYGRYCCSMRLERIARCDRVRR